MSNKKIVSAFIVSIFGISSYAQNETDAMRYSNISFGGTARYNAMGGAFGALGGDISCMGINPAGIARYTKSDFNFTLLYEDISTNTTYLGTNTTGGKGNFNLGSVGFVGTKKLDDYDWRFMQFGFSYQRSNFFHSHQILRGTNTSSSIADVFRDRANGYTVDELATYLPNSSSLAYQVYVIDPVDSMASTTTYTDRVPDGIAVDQAREITRYGNMSEFNFTFAGNYKDKLYVGGSFCIPGVRFEEDFHHSEVLNDPDSLTSLNDFSYVQSLNTRGVGFNAKVGLIYLPVDWVRLGAAFHTPNFLSFTDSWHNSMTSNFEGGEEYSYEGPLNTYVWRLRTPPRFMGSVAVILFKRAAISIDAEYVDYTRMRLKRDWADQTGYNFATENDIISKNFRSVVNLRAGAEVRIKPIYLRAGYSLNPSAFNSGLTKTDASIQTVSGGLGYKNNGFSIDLGVNFVTYGEDYYPYDPVLLNNQPGQISTSIIRTSVTCGWRF